MEESPTVSQKPDGESISRRRTTETNDLGNTVKTEIKKKHVDLTI